MKVWLDGVVLDGAEACIPVTDHGLLYGDGIFEGLRVIRGRVFRLEDHLARFASAARALALQLPHDRDAIREIILETVRAHGTPDAYVRLILTRGDGSLGVDPTNCPSPRLICIVAVVEIYSEEILARGLDLVTSSLRRPPPDVLDPRVKSLNYLNNAMAKLEARQRGADEALMLNAAGNIAEASVANLFVLRDGELRTPPGSDGALEGITRRTLLELADQMGLPARECTLGRFDVFAAEEIILCGTGAGIVSVRSLDGRSVGGGRPGPVSQKLRAAYLDAAVSLGTPVGLG